MNCKEKNCNGIVNVVGEGKKKGICQRCVDRKRKEYHYKYYRANKEKFNYEAYKHKSTGKVGRPAKNPPKPLPRLKKKKDFTCADIQKLSPAKMAMAINGILNKKYKYSGGTKNRKG